MNKFDGYTVVSDTRMLHLDDGMSLDQSKMKVWVDYSNCKKSTIETLPVEQSMNDLSDLEYFQKRIMESLKVPYWMLGAPEEKPTPNMIPKITILKSRSRLPHSLSMNFDRDLGKILYNRDAICFDRAMKAVC